MTDDEIAAVYFRIDELIDELKAVNTQVERLAARLHAQPRGTLATDPDWAEYRRWQESA